MTLRRLIIVLYLLCLAGLGGWAGLYFLDARQEYERLKTIEIRNRLRLEEAEKRLAEEDKILERLRTDHAYVEEVIRRNLGYAKPGEYIFRFEE